MKVAAATLLAMMAASVEADIYMHNPRGSNNRNCRTDNNKQRRNGNRLFDSQNNDNGGYSCPRAWPFDCYKYVDDGGAFNQCQNQNNNANKNMLNAVGDLVNPAAVNTDMMYYYSGSELSLEWTAQHGMGTNSEVVADIVVQYACQDTLTDNCADAPAGANPYVADPNGQQCVARDGTPVRVADGNNGLNAEATDTIPDNANDQDDMRYGRHETFAYYQECKNRERNQGLWAADQDLNGNDARTTRQNPNANRNGLECPEESEYYPYWHYSPWKDVAVVTNDAARCTLYQTESQNVKGKGRCNCNGNCNGNGNQPNNAQACAAVAGAEWVEDAAHGLPPPECLVGAYSRQNHLGNVGAGANAAGYNWTLPEVQTEQTCVLRIRYNMTSTDFGGVPQTADARLNGAQSPLKDNDENEALTYIPINGMSQKSQLGFAVNTDQYARTFEDRSYMFKIKPRTGANGRVLQEVDGCKKVYNLNVRGKRGNIVQTYPAVEYDFTPDHLLVEKSDCIHTQWTGSDYNPNRDGNNGEAGPYASNNQNKDTKSDRSNIIQMNVAGDNMPSMDSSSYNMFNADAETWHRLAFLDQNVDGAECWTFDQLQNEYNNRDEREETYHNCMKLSGSATPHFDGGVQRMGAEGGYEYISSRNNNFSNRGMKGRIDVLSDNTTPEVQPDGTIAAGGSGSESSSSGVSAGGVSGAAIAGIAVGVLAVGGFLYSRNKKSGNSGAGAKMAAPNAVNPYGGAAGGYGQQAPNPYYGQQGQQGRY